MSKNGSLFDPTLIAQADQAAKTVAKLAPAASVGPGGSDFVIDATTTTFGSAVVGGGANKVPVYSDGSVWRIG